MSSSRDVAVAGTLALVIALSAIAAITLSGLAPVSPPGGTVLSSTSAYSSQTGVLSVLLTDPPIAPSGVTAIYITYSDLAVHVSGSDLSSGWTELSGSGTIDLMKAVNISQTVASQMIKAGTYNVIRFNISSSQVTYNGVNYTAFVPSGRLTVPIPGGLHVLASSPSAAIIDIRPLVVNIGSLSAPEFILRPSASALPVPPGQVTREMTHPGGRFQLTGISWWELATKSSARSIEITSATLKPDLLSVTVKNTGQDTVLYAVAVVPYQGYFGGSGGHKEPGATSRMIPSSLLGAAIFMVEKNGSLLPAQKVLSGLPARGGLAGALSSLFGQSGYNLTAGSSVTLTFNGQVSLGIELFGLQSVTTPVSPGAQYVITVLGQDTSASYVIVAAP